MWQSFILGGGEQCGNFADQLHCLADKAFPRLVEDAKERLTLDRYLSNTDGFCSDTLR